GIQTLDVAGPGEVFGTATRLEKASYSVVLAARAGTIIETACGFRIRAEKLDHIRLRADDTVIVSGGKDDALRAAPADAKLAAWLARAAGVVRRIGSVCSGAFLLARAGLLDGRRVATHWAGCEKLARYRPAVRVDRNAIFVRDGNVWTSAGVTTGIDM